MSIDLEAKSASNKAYYAAHKEEIAKRNKIYWSNNRDTIKARYFANHDENLAKAKVYRSANKEILAERSHAYYIKTRESTGYPLGSSNHNSKLTEDRVREIRVLHSGGATQCSLSGIYGVSGCSISKIVNRITWKHVA